MTRSSGLNPISPLRRNEMRISRRHFMASMIGAMSASAMIPLSHADQNSVRKIQVGAHPWVYAATQPDYDITPILETIFSDMRYAGLDGIELMHTALRPDDAETRIYSLSEKYRLPVIGTSFGGDFWNREKHAEVLKDAERIIPRLAKLGGKTLGTSMGSAGHPKTEAEFDAQTELLRKVILLCEENGVVLNLHNHTYEVENRLHDLKGTLARIPDVKLGPDLDWLVQAGVDPVQFIHQFGDRIVFLHLRDQKKDKTWVESLGEGDMDYRAVGQALRDIHFSGIAVIELAHPSGFQPTRPLRESLKMSREYLRETVGF